MTCSRGLNNHHRSIKMNISEIQKKDEPAFDAMALEYGTLFIGSQWTSIFNGVRRYGIYNKGQELIGGFITYREKKFGLSIYRNPPYTPDIGPFLKVDASNPVSIMDNWKKALSLIADFLEQLPYSVMSFAVNPNTLDMQPFIWKKFKVIPGYTYILDLSKSVDDIWKGMSNERRKNINKGLKDSLSTQKADNLEIVRSLVLKTYSRQEKTTNEFYLNKVLFDYANDNNSFSYVTYQNDRPIACTFCIFDKKTVYYLLGGYDSNRKHHGAGAMAMWESIKYAKDSGLLYFDFEGSMNQNIEKYFRGFGGQLTPYYRINKAKLPLEIIMKFFKRELF